MKKVCRGFFVHSDLLVKYQPGPGYMELYLLYSHMLYVTAQSTSLVPVTKWWHSEAVQTSTRFNHP